MTKTEWEQYLIEIFPQEVIGFKRPGNVETDLDFSTNFPQFIPKDKALYTLLNAFLRQLFSNDVLLNQWVEELQKAMANQDFNIVTEKVKGLMSAADKVKLNGIAEDAEVNQNAFSTINGVVAKGKTDTVNFVAGDNVVVDVDAANKKIILSAQDTTYGLVSTTGSGLVPTRDGSATKFFRADGTWATISIPSSLPANGGTADYASYLWSTTHKGQFYISNAWDGTYWNLTSNHGSPVRVGYADRANLLTSLSGDANYKLGYTADGSRNNPGEWGRVVMRYDPNGQTYGVRCDRADNADTVGGYSADALRNRTAGRTTPVLTPLIDWSQAQGVGTNSGAGLTGQGSGDIYLKQSYKNFDKILIHMMDGEANWSEQFLWEKWEIDYAMGNTYRWTLGRSGTGAIWIVWSGVNLGTAAHPLSTETCWKTQSNNCKIKEIYGLTY